MPIDVALRKQLEARGMFDKIAELEGTLSNKEKSRKMFSSMINKKIQSRKKIRDKVIPSVAKFVAPVGESIGGAIAIGKFETPKKLQKLGVPKVTLQTKSSKEFEKGQEKTLNREADLQKQVLRQMKDPNIPKKNKFKLLSTNLQNNPNLLSQIPEANKTAKQIFGEGAMTALNTLMAGTTVGKLQAAGKISKAMVDLSKFVKTLGKGEVAVKGLKGAVEGVEKIPLATKIAGTTLRTAKTAVEGAAFGAAMALEEGKTSKKDIGKEAALFSSISSIIPPVLGKTLKTVFKGSGALMNLANEGAEKLIPKLESYSQKIKGGSGNFLIDNATQHKANLPQSLASITAKGLKKATTPLEPALTDRLYHLKKFDEFVENKTGFKISDTLESAYIKARNYAGIEGKYAVAAHDFDKIINKDFQGIKDELLGYINGTDLLNRAKSGLKVMDDKSIKSLEKELLDIEKKVIAKGGTVQDLEAGLTAYNNYTKTHIMDELVDSGLISKADSEAMLKAHPNWTPHQVLDFTEEMANNTFMRGGSLNVADSGVKGAKGSTRETADVVTSTLYRTQQVKTLAERNRVMNKVFDNVNKLPNPEEYGFVKLSAEKVDGPVLKSTGKVDTKKAGFEKVSYFKNGVKEDWLVPTDLGIALKNLDAPQAGLITSILKKPADWLRAGATRLNPAFSLSNMPRDIQTAAGISKNGFTREQWIKAVGEVADLDNPETRAFYEGGGAFGGVISAEKPSRDILAASKRAPILNAGSSLAKVIESMGERIENATRRAVYDNAVKNGMPHELAIFESRNATVDFAKQGNVIGVLNQVIPFLNARAQGLVNTVTTLKDDPTKFIRRQLFQSAYPAMYLYGNNNQYESFKNIPQFERDQNWIIMYGETDGFDNSGAPIKVPEYIKIKKGEVQAPIANAIEDYLRRSSGEDPRGVKKFLAEQVISVSPVGISSFGPLATPIELTANYDLFTEGPIEPKYQQITPGGQSFERKNIDTVLRANKWTGETAKHLSSIGLNKIGLSPARIEFIIGKLTGTAGKDLLKLVDMTQTGWDQTGIAGNKATTEQKLARTPLFRTFIGSNASAEKIMLYETIDELEKNRTQKIDMQEDLQAAMILEQANAAYKTSGMEEANNIIKAHNPNKDVQKRMKRIQANLQAGQTIQKQMYDKIRSTDVKVDYMIEILNSIPGLENKNKFIKDMDMSKSVSDRLKSAFKQGLLKQPATN